MASTIPFQLVFPTELIDIIDSEWMADLIPQNDDPLPPGITLPPDDLDEFGGLGSVLSLGNTRGGGGGESLWLDLALGELQ